MSTQLTGAVSVASQDMYKSSTVQLHNFGELVFTNDGRGFRYAGASGSAAIVSGRLQQATVENTSDENLSIAAASVGDLLITTTSTLTVGANRYAGGWVVVTTGPGVGKVYKVKSHVDTQAAVMVINLEDPIQVALTTSSKIDLITNPYKNILVNPTVATAAPVGVAVCPIGAGEFGWVGVLGPQPCTASSAIAVGSPVVASGAAGGAGAVDAIAYDGRNPVGVALTGIAAVETGLVRLMIN